MSAEVIRALVAAKKQFKAIRKDTQGYNYKYFDLSEIKEATNEALLDQGLVVIQHPLSDKEKGLGIRTEIQHHEGVMSYEFFAPPQFTQVNQEGIQALGSIITYLKRYHLCALLGLAEDDDDCASVVNQTPRQQAKTPNPKPKPKRIKDHKEFLTLKAIVVKHKYVSTLDSAANGNWEELAIEDYPKVRAFVSDLVTKAQAEEMGGE